MKRIALALFAAILTSCGGSTTPAATSAAPVSSGPPPGSLALVRQQPSKGIALLFVTDVSGTEVRRVTLGDPIEQYGGAVWSPDGASILVTNTLRLKGGQPLPFRPAIVSGDGSSYRLLQVPGGPFDMFCDVWSPDGARVICQFGGKAPGIFTIRSADGGDPVRLTRNPFGSRASDTPGDLSADGSQIVFMRFRPMTAAHDDAGALFVKSMDGTGSTQITPYGLPQWEEFGWAAHWLSRRARDRVRQRGGPSLRDPSGWDRPAEDPRADGGTALLRGEPELVARRLAHRVLDVVGRTRRHIHVGSGRPAPLTSHGFHSLGQLVRLVGALTRAESR